MSITINNEIKQNNISTIKTATAPVNFRANSSNTLERTPETDAVETKKEEKKGLSKLAKIGLGITGGFAALIVTMSLISKGRIKHLTKIYKEKMAFKELPEKIEFKEAKTLEEAIKFSKETLKIEDIDANFSLEALNFLNKGLVDVSNANKGKLFIPKKVRFRDSEKSWIASVEQDIESKSFGTMFINKKYFNNEFLDKRLKENLFVDKTGKPFFDSKNVYLQFKNANVCFVPDNSYYNLLQKYYKNPNNLSVIEKRELFWGYNAMSNRHAEVLKYRPDLYYEAAIKQNGSQKYTLKQFKELDIEKQREILKETLDKKAIVAQFERNSGLKTVYHEMGHLQDFAKNLKELDLKTWEFNPIKIMKEAWKEVQEQKLTGIKKDTSRLKFVDNRWGGTTYDGYKDLLKKDPKKFEAYYPDLYKHLTDIEIQNITGQVSWYSQTSIGEFVAEVYAGLINGRKFSNEVINLYKKYNGPLLPGM